MDTEKINEFVSDVTGDVAEISPDDMNNNLGNDDADNTNHDMENLAATMDNLEVGDQNDDTENTVYVCLKICQWCIRGGSNSHRWGR